MLGLPTLPVMPQAASLQQQLAAAELLQPALMAGLAEQLGGQGQGVLQGAGQVPRPPPGEDGMLGAGGLTRPVTGSVCNEGTCSLWQHPFPQPPAAAHVPVIRQAEHPSRAACMHGGRPMTRMPLTTA